MTTPESGDEIHRILAEMRVMRDETIRVRDAALLATSDMPRCPGCGGGVPRPVRLPWWRRWLT